MGIFFVVGVCSLDLLLRGIVTAANISECGVLIIHPAWDHNNFFSIDASTHLGAAIEKMRSITSRVFCEQINSVSSIKKHLDTYASQVEVIIFCGHGTPTSMQFGGKKQEAALVETEEDTGIQIEEGKEGELAILPAKELEEAIDPSTDYTLTAATVTEEMFKSVRANKENNLRIELLSCEVGFGGAFSLADTIARVSEVPVYAPTQKIYDTTTSFNPFFHLATNGYPLLMESGVIYSNEEILLYSAPGPLDFFRCPLVFSQVVAHLTSGIFEEIAIAGAEYLLSSGQIENAMQVINTIQNGNALLKFARSLSAGGNEEYAIQILSRIGDIEAERELVKIYLMANRFDEAEKIAYEFQDSSSLYLVGEQLINCGYIEKVERLIFKIPEKKYMAHLAFKLFLSGNREKALRLMSASYSHVYYYCCELASQDFLEEMLSIARTKLNEKYRTDLIRYLIHWGGEEFLRCAHKLMTTIKAEVHYYKIVMKYIDCNEFEAGRKYTNFVTDPPHLVMIARNFACKRQMKDVKKVGLRIDDIVGLRNIVIMLIKYEAFLELKIMLQAKGIRSLTEYALEIIKAEAYNNTVISQFKALLMKQTVIQTRRSNPTTEVHKRNPRYSRLGEIFLRRR